MSFVTLGISLAGLGASCTPCCKCARGTQIILCTYLSDIALSLLHTLFPVQGTYLATRTVGSPSVSRVLLGIRDARKAKCVLQGSRSDATLPTAGSTAQPMWRAAFFLFVVVQVSIAKTPHCHDVKFKARNKFSRSQRLTEQVDWTKRSALAQTKRVLLGHYAERAAYHHAVRCLLLRAQTRAGLPR